MGFKNHELSLNQALVNDEDKGLHTYTDKFFYWYFFHTY